MCQPRAESACRASQSREQHAVLTVQMDPVLTPVPTVHDEPEAPAEQRAEPVPHPHTPVPVIQTEHN